MLFDITYISLHIILTSSIHVRVNVLQNIIRFAKTVIRNYR